MTGTRISSASAGVLLLGGIALLFAADAILPLLIRGFPLGGAWLGQLVGAAWLGVAALDWLSRSMLLGGIYGRGVVSANAALYFISATTLLKVALRSDGPNALWWVTVPIAILAGLYGWLLFRGPFERDLELHRRALHA
jgi:hypothetical protein